VCLQVSLSSGLEVTLSVFSGVFIFKSGGDFSCVFGCLSIQVWRSLFVCLQVTLYSNLEATLGMSSGVFIFKSEGDLVVSSGFFIFKSGGDFSYVFRCFYIQVWR